jgi:uncharacterized protein YndB with AHSA1/START domain
MIQNEHGNQPLGRQLVNERVFNASRVTVFKMWTEAEHLENWWGPAEFHLKIKQLDVKPGGVFHYSIDNNGMEMWGKFIYVEVVPPEKLVFINTFSDEDGNITPSPFMPDWPLEVINTVMFEEREGKTTLTIKGKPHNASEEQQKAFESAIGSMEQGFGGTFDKLEHYLLSLN